MNVRRDLQIRLSRLEAETRDSRADLRAMMLLDKPLLFGSAEHTAALADPVKYDLANREVFRRPTLPSRDPGDVWPDDPVL